MINFESVYKKSKKKGGLLDRTLDFLSSDSKKKSSPSLQFTSVKGILEQIKAISSEKERLAEIKRQARIHALDWKNLEEHRNLLESMTINCIQYKDLSHSQQKEVDKVFEKLLKELSLDKFLKTHADPIKAKIDREKILHDILNAKKHDIKRFADIAKHYKKNLKI